MTDSISLDAARFVEDSRFAKIVDTADGPAILIAGTVINIRSINPAFHVDALTRALRRAESVGGSCSAMEKPSESLHHHLD